MKKRRFNVTVFSSFVFCITVTGFFLYSMPPAAAPSEPDAESEQEAPESPQEQQEVGAAPSAEQADDQQVEGQEEPGPETTDFAEEEIGAQGNWVKKKDWLLKSYELRDQVNDLIVEIQRARKIFDDKYEDIDKDLDQFYKELGLDQGKLEELFGSLIKYLEKKKKQTMESLTSGEAADKGRDREMVMKIGVLEEQVRTYAQQMEQLKLDMQSIEDLDKSLAERLQKVDEQIALAVKEAGSAEKIIQTLWQIIDHNKARAQYYQLKSSTLEKLQSIASYLNNALLQDFERAGQTIKSQLTKTIKSVKVLEEKGFIIKDRSRRIQSIKLKELRAEAEAEKKAKEQETEVALGDQKKSSLQKTWYVHYYDLFTDIIADSIKFFQTTFARLLGMSQPSKPKKAMSAVPAVQQKEAKQEELQTQKAPTEQVRAPVQKQSAGMPTATLSKPLTPVMPALPNPFVR